MRKSPFTRAERVAAFAGNKMEKRVYTLAVQLRVSKLRCNSVAEGLVAGGHSPYLVQRVLTLAVQLRDPPRCSPPHTLRRGPCGTCVRADKGWLARGQRILERALLPRRVRCWMQSAMKKETKGNRS